MNALTAPQSLGHFLPELVLIATILVVFVVDLVVANMPQRELPAAGISMLGLVAAIALCVPQWTATPQAIFSGMAVVDPFSVFFKMLVLLGTLAAILFMYRSSELVRDAVGETYALLLVFALSAMLLTSANNLLMLYLALEGLSLASYVLAGFSRNNRRASEAALKYVIYGGVASGVMLFGLSYVYGLTGTLDLVALSERLAALTAAAGGATKALNLTLVVAVVFVIAGVGYKIAVAPFHMWCPDVYEGAPTPIAAVFSVVPKAAGVALLVRFFYVGFAEAGAQGQFEHATTVPWIGLFGVIAAATMTIGNFGALWQTNMKRLLAYSSIAHVGYVLMGFVVMGTAGLSAMLFYVAIYTLMNLGAFFSVIVIRNDTGREDLEGARGFGYREPMVAAAFTVFLLSLTGLPPLAGFIAKYFLFASVLEHRGLWYDLLVVVAVLNSAVSLFYYVKILRAMYLSPAVDRRPAQVPVLHTVTLLVFAAATLMLGFWAPGITKVKGVSDRALVFEGQGRPRAQVAAVAPTPDQR